LAGADCEELFDLLWENGVKSAAGILAMGKDELISDLGIKAFQVRLLIGAAEKHSGVS